MRCNMIALAAGERMVVPTQTLVYMINEMHNRCTLNTVVA